MWGLLAKVEVGAIEVVVTPDLTPGRVLLLNEVVAEHVVTVVLFN